MSDEEPNETQQRKKMHQGAFLAAFERTAHIGLSAEAAGINRWNHWEWLKTDPDYAAEFEKAKAVAQMVLEDEVVRRAVHGTEEAVYHDGKVVGHHLRYSDVLLMFKLKALDPRIYREHQTIEHTGKDGAQLIPLEAWDAIGRALASNGSSSV